MKITREQAVAILQYRRKNPDFYFPFDVMCQEVDQDNRDEKDEDFIGVEPEDLDEEDDTLPEWYQTFELRENLNNLDEETEMLLAKGFLDRMWVPLDLSKTPREKLLKEYSEAIEQYHDAVTDIDFIGEGKVGTETETFERGYVIGLGKALELVYSVHLFPNPHTEWNNLS